MADYTSVSQYVPSQARSMLIDNVAVGDQIDLVDVLGRPARAIKFIMTDSTDTIDYKLNNRIKLDKRSASSNEWGTEVVWSQSGSFPTYRSTGAEEHETEEGLNIGSVEIVALTLSSGTTIQIVAW